MEDSGVSQDGVAGGGGGGAAAVLVEMEVEGWVSDVIVFGDILRC